MCLQAEIRLFPLLPTCPRLMLPCIRPCFSSYLTFLHMIFIAFDFLTIIASVVYLLWRYIRFPFYELNQYAAPGRLGMRNWHIIKCSSLFFSLLLSVPSRSRGPKNSYKRNCIDVATLRFSTLSRWRKRTQKKKRTAFKIHSKATYSILL